MLQYSIALTQTPDLIQQLSAKGGDTSFAILMFDRPSGRPGPSGSINLQYSIYNGKLGLDWVLLNPRNIADKEPLVEFIRQHGHSLAECALNGVSYLRVEDGNLTGLGIKIATEFYSFRP